MGSYTIFIENFFSNDLPGKKVYTETQKYVFLVWMCPSMQLKAMPISKQSSSGKVY